MENWYAVYLKWGHEKAVSRRLEGAGIETLSPLLRQKRFRNNRMIETIEPLFPCYVFARFDPDAHFRMISYTRGVRYIVGGAFPMSVPVEIIGSIRGKIAGGVIALKPEDIEEGGQVMIKDGPFAGYYGLFKRYTKGSERCLVLLEALGWTLETDNSMVVRT